MTSPLPNLARDLLESACYIVALTGAGISTPSGIPDFRSPTSGFWTNDDPMIVASIQGFRRNPQAFYDWVRPLMTVTANAKPNSAHLALANMEVAGRLKAVITQNIDGLHTAAGSQCVIELHGHGRTMTCQRCARQMDSEAPMTAFVSSGRIPRCTCGGVLKPDTVLFGEMLPYQALVAAQQHVASCDLMIVVGSSLQVMPASELPREAVLTGSRLIIVNYEPTPMDAWADLILRDDVANVLPQLAALI